MSILSSLNQSRFAICSVLLLCVAITFCFAPGHMDADALGMLFWVKSGIYADWYPLLLPCLLKVAVVLQIGPTAVLAGQVLAVGMCTYAVLAFFASPIIAAICTYGVILCPAVLGYLGAITSHGILTAFLLCGFTGLLYLTRQLSPKQQLVLFGLSFGALALATIARQNGAAFTLPLYFVWMSLFLKRFISRGIFRRLTALVLSCLIIVGVTAFTKYIFVLLLHPVHNEPAEALALYDISAISLRAHHLYLDRKHFPNQSLNDLQTIFRENNPDILTFRGWANIPPLRIYHDPVDRSKLLHTLVECITQHPGYYVTERYHVFRGLLGLDFHSPPAVPFHPGIDGNTLDYHIDNPKADHLVVTYLGTFQDSFVDRPFIYFLFLFVAGGIIPSMLQQSPGVRLVLLSLAAGSLLNLTGYFFASPSTLLRYIWPSIVSNMIVTAVVAPYCFQLLRKREWSITIFLDVLLDRRLRTASIGARLNATESGEAPVRVRYQRLRRIHSTFTFFAKRISTTEFLTFDVWAIWFYAACLTVFLLVSILGLNGSSISIYHSGYGRGAATRPLIGQPHSIQMEEWDFHTPAILNQAIRFHPFRVKSTPLGGHSVALFGNVPVAHISTLFRPQFWPFFVLPVEYAYAAYWQFKALILLTGVFTWLLFLTRSTLWAATGSLWYFFSPFTQWSYSWPSLLPEMIGSICFAMVFACYLTVGKNRPLLAAAAVGFSIGVINFGLCADLSYIIPFIWLAALFFAGWCVAQRGTIWNRRNELSTERRNLVIAAVSVVAVVSVLTCFQASDAIKGIADTVYPGKRFYEGGSLNIQGLLAHFFNWFNSEGHFPPGLGNIRDAAGFIWLAPVTLFCVDRLRLSSFQKASLVALSGLSVLLLAWLLIPVPQWFGSMLALTRTGKTRPIPALGLANIGIVALTMSSFCSDIRRQMRMSFRAILRRTTGVLLLVALLLILTDQVFGWFYSWQQLLFAITLTTLLISLIMHGSRRVLPFLIVIPSVFAFGMVNPVEHGLGVITSSNMYRFVRTNQDFLASKWLVFSDSLWIPGFLTAMGCQVYDGLHYLPDVDHFWLFAARGLDVKAFNQDGYLLAHPIGPNEKTTVQVVGPGWTRWNVSPSDPLLKKLGIKYVAFDRKPADNLVVQLAPLSIRPIDNYWLYRIP